MNIRLITVCTALALLPACTNHEISSPAAESNPSMVIADHISNLRVNTFAEDKYGHIWMGTQRGLDRFNGLEFQQFFCTDDSLGLPDNQISVVHAAKDGQIWISTVNGVAKTSENGGFQRIPVANFNRNFNVILETRDGNLFFTDNTSLLAYDKQQEVIHPVIREFNAFGVPSAILDGDDYIWAITDGGWSVTCFNSKDYSQVYSVAIPHQAYHICDAQDGTIWLSGMGRLSILDRATRQWLPIPDAVKADKRLIHGDIDILFSPDANSMLLNVIGQGVFYWQKSIDKVTFQDDADFPFDIPEGEIRAIFKDSHRNLWFGTTDRGYGVSYQDKSLFGSNKFLTQAFKDKSVNSLCADKAGNLWISTLRDGLWCYNLASGKLVRSGAENLVPDQGVGYIRTTKVFCDSQGELWLLFMDKMRVLRCTWDGKRLIQKDNLFIYNPMSITEDDQGHIWIGGFSGFLARYDKTSRKTDGVAVISEGQWTMVPDILMREAGRLVVSRFNMRPVEVNTYTMEVSEIPEDNESPNLLRRSLFIPSKLLIDSSGDIWTATIANGLLVYNTKTGSLKSVDGLPCQDVCSLEEDRQGNIWVSTMNGLAKYDRTVGRYIHYFETDGIGGNQFSERASCILPSGVLVFGGAHGITWFNPLDAPARRTVPVVFQNLTIHNQVVWPSENGPIQKVMPEKPKVTINHKQNAFSISFAALDYSHFQQIRYAYKLEGFDKDWVKINTRHDAYFANVPSGHYKLRVRIANGSHTVTETEESIDIRILPPWYASWWAILLYVLAGAFLVGVGYTFYRHVRRVRKEAAKRIREVRREREKAEEAEKQEKALNKIQQNYFANVAHEFRTPLTMIAGPADQLSASPGIKGQDRQLVDIIRRNSTWMLSLVNQLLDFNRIGNSKLQMKVAKMDIVKPLHDIADLFSYNAGSKGIDLSTYGLDDPFTMWVDADKVQKIVMNLMSNALKFTPSGGKVSLAFDVVPREEAAKEFPLTEADTDGQYACIRVSDTGPGIPEDKLEKIFERFYQSDAGMKAMGSGIGLYYARVLTGLHHGYIKAANRPEGGAVLSMILPVSASSYTEDERTNETPQLQVISVPQADATASATEESSKKHIAVVDDDIDIANYLKIMLAPHYSVSLYFDAQSALKGMEEDVPDLVISDVVMPGMSGYELCEKIKGDLQLSHIPVVLVTAKVAVESQIQGLDKGADAYVTKPFQPAYLLALVKSLLENREKLHRLLGTATKAEEIAPDALSPRDAAFMKDLYELMEKELSNADLDVMRITEMMKISRTKFYYKVKGLTGENPSVFFKRYKLNRAAELLKEGKNNMSEIAWMTGFNTLSHFSTSFKKQFGVPPSEYVG